MKIQIRGPGWGQQINSKDWEFDDEKYIKKYLDGRIAVFRPSSCFIMIWDRTTSNIEHVYQAQSPTHAMNYCDRWVGTNEKTPDFFDELGELDFFGELEQVQSPDFFGELEEI